MSSTLSIRNAIFILRNRGLAPVKFLHVALPHMSINPGQLFLPGVVLELPPQLFLAALRVQLPSRFLPELRALPFHKLPAYGMLCKPCQKDRQLLSVSKGFPDESGSVFHAGGQPLLLLSGSLRFLPASVCEYGHSAAQMQDTDLPVQ